MQTQRSQKRTKVKPPLFPPCFQEQTVQRPGEQQRTPVPGEGKLLVLGQQAGNGPKETKAGAQVSALYRILSNTVTGLPAFQMS